MKDAKLGYDEASGKIFGTRIRRVDENQQTDDLDYLAVEDPLEIVVEYGPADARKLKTISITMRTPGHDKELAAGFLFSEGLFTRKEDLQAMRIEGQNDKIKGNRIIISLQPSAPFDPELLNRNFYMTSSCGVCGKASIDAVRMTAFPALEKGRPEFSASFFHQLPQKLVDQQQIFEHTGGLHAAALFNKDGEIKLLMEDIGRHNAVDKIIGAALFLDMLPLEKFAILVSGRISFELVQKSLMAGLPVMAAVGAPSSLAVQLAQRFGMSLVGFIRNGKYNIYSGRERIK